MQIHNLVCWPAHLTMLEAARDRGQVGLIGAVQVPYNPDQCEVERTILPLAGELGLGVLLMRPLGEGRLLRLPPGPAELEPLRPFGVTSWAQALIKWGLSDPRVHVSLAATAQPGRLAENAAAGSPALVRTGRAGLRATPGHSALTRCTSRPRPTAVAASRDAAS